MLKTIFQKPAGFPECNSCSRRLTLTHRMLGEVGCLCVPIGIQADWWGPSQVGKTMSSQWNVIRILALTGSGKTMQGKMGDEFGSRDSGSLTSMKLRSQSWGTSEEPFGTDPQFRAPYLILVIADVVGVISCWEFYSWYSFSRTDLMWITLTIIFLLESQYQIHGQFSYVWDHPS